jgi:hypothetical protein
VPERPGDADDDARPERTDSPLEDWQRESAPPRFLQPASDERRDRDCRNRRGRQDAGAVGFAVGALLRRYAGLGGATNGG